MSVQHKVLRQIEQLTALDKAAKPLAKLVGRAVQPRPVRNLLSGAQLGHPLHPMLTDVPIGAWTAAAVLDAVGGVGAEPAADLLVGTGILAAVPAAASGLNDWSDTYGPETRIGLVHAAANVVGLGLYIGSMFARLRGNRTSGRALGFAALTTVAAGGYLGGHLAFVKGVNVNHTAFELQPEEWTPVLAEAELAEGAHRAVTAAGTPVLLARDGGRLHALANTCSHAGGPLEEGTFADGCVTCPWHGSIFRLADGSVVRGPASVAQPAYDTRVRDGQIEVRVAQ